MHYDDPEYQASVAAARKARRERTLTPPEQPQQPGSEPALPVGTSPSSWSPPSYKDSGGGD